VSATLPTYSEADMQGMSPREYDKAIQKCRTLWERLQTADTNAAKAAWKFIDALGAIPIRTIRDHYGIPQEKVCDDIGIAQSHLRELLQASRLFPKDSPRLDDIGWRTHMQAYRNFGDVDEATTWMKMMVSEHGTVRFNDALELRGMTARRGATQGRSAKDWPEWEGWKAVFPLRDAKGLTQMELAKKSKTSVQFVQRLESGKITNPSIRALLAVADALGVTVRALVDEADIRRVT
jgi:transcriptional regulator with XRE-family HTH domain